MNHESRIYVAGHTGLIGAAVLHRLKVERFRNVLTRSRSQLDLQESGKVSQFFDEVCPEYVVLAAGRVGGIVENQTFPAAFIEENIGIELNVLRAARRTGVRKLIFFGSSCMYPRDCAQPMAEQTLLTGALEPTSLPYAISKLAGTYLCLAYNKQDGETRFLPVIPNSVYGPHDNFDPSAGHVLSSLMAKFHRAKAVGDECITLWGTGTPRREFIHADDVATVCLHLMRRDCSGVEFPLNIGVGTDVSIRELAELIAVVVGYEGRVDWDTSKSDGAARKLLDSGRLRALGWKPTSGLAEGLSMTYRWYVENMVGQE